MIFVTTGFHNVPFDRLIRWVDEIALQGAFAEPFLVQKGHSELPLRACEGIDFVQMDDFADYVRRSKCVITHGGTGSVMTSLMAGKRPILVPRLSQFGEVCNDHQLEIAREFERKGWVCVATDKDQIVSHLEALLANGGGSTYTPNNARLLGIVSDCLAQMGAGGVAD